MFVFFRSGSHVAAAAGLRWDDSYPFVCSVVPKNLRLKGYLALPLPLPLQPKENQYTPNPSRERAKRRCRGKGVEMGLGLNDDRFFFFWVN